MEKEKNIILMVNQDLKGIIGKRYFNNGKVEFEGYYLNGVKNGKGNEFYDNGKLAFEGKYINGEKVY